jgi:hypothetical protein
MLPRSCSVASSTKIRSTLPSGSVPEQPIREPSSAWLGEQMSTCERARVVSRSWSGMQRSGTGSQMKRGRGSALGVLICFRRERIEVTSSIQRVGEDIM